MYESNIKAIKLETQSIFFSNSKRRENYNKILKIRIVLSYKRYLCEWGMAKSF